MSDQIPHIPQAPQSSQTPQALQSSQTQQIPQAPQSSQTQQAPQSSQAQQIPQTPQTPQTPGRIYPDIAGVVMAGGRSTRMGVEKAHIRAYGQTQPDMLARTRSLLAQVTGQVWVSCRPDNPKEGLCIFDQHQGLGPFGGLYTALVRAREEGLSAVLPLSCDLPFMDEATLRQLLHARDAALGTRVPQPDAALGTRVLQPDAARQTPTTPVPQPDDALPPLMTTFLQSETGFIESLTAVYEVAALPFFEEALARDERKLSRIIPPQRRTHIPYVHSQALPFFNLNYPADLEVFRRMLAALAR